MTRSLDSVARAVLLRGDSESPLLETLARELLDTQVRLERALCDNRRLIGERDAALSGRTTARPVRRAPELEIQCAGCVRKLTIMVRPPEDAIPGWARGQGWAVDGDRYLCAGCR